MIPLLHIFLICITIHLILTSQVIAKQKHRVPAFSIFYLTCTSCPVLLVLCGIHTVSIIIVMCATIPFALLAGDCEAEAPGARRCTRRLWVWTDALHRAARNRGVRALLIYIFIYIYM